MQFCIDYIQYSTYDWRLQTAVLLSKLQSKEISKNKRKDNQKRKKLFIHKQAINFYIADTHILCKRPLHSSETIKKIAVDVFLF